MFVNEPGNVGRVRPCMFCSDVVTPSVQRQEPGQHVGAVAARRLTNASVTRLVGEVAAEQEEALRTDCPDRTWLGASWPAASTRPPGWFSGELPTASAGSPPVSAWGRMRTSRGGSVGSTFTCPPSKLLIRVDGASAPAYRFDERAAPRRGTRPPLGAAGSRHRVDSCRSDGCGVPGGVLRRDQPHGGLNSARAVGHGGPARSSTS